MKLTKRITKSQWHFCLLTNYSRIYFRMLYSLSISCRRFIKILLLVILFFVWENFAHFVIVIYSSLYLLAQFHDIQSLLYSILIKNLNLKCWNLPIFTHITDQDEWLKRIFFQIEDSIHSSFPSSIVIAAISGIQTCIEIRINKSHFIRFDLLTMMSQIQDNNRTS